MTDVPVLSPVTIPLAAIVATEGVDELHAPPVVTSTNAVVVPAHNAVDPVITAGSAFTVSAVILLQPVPVE